MKDLVIGVDVGGTNIKLGVITPSGKIIVRNNLKTKTYSWNKKRLIQVVADACLEIVQSCHVPVNKVSGIGIGLPGLINASKGIVNSLTNIAGWQNVPLKKILETRLKVPVFIENDVNLITLGEWKFGAGKGLKNLVCITLGTGVGGGLILDNHLYRGEGYAAGEVGHIPVNEEGPGCNCGGWGCFERYVGNQYLWEKAEKIFERQDIKLEDVYTMALNGDGRAIQFWADTGRHIGNALTGVVNLLNPTHIIIGGGIAKSYRFFARTIRETIKKRAMKVQGRMVKVVRAKLGDDAGIIGAQELVRAGLTEGFS